MPNLEGKRSSMRCDEIRRNITTTQGKEALRFQGWWEVGQKKMEYLNQKAD